MRKIQQGDVILRTVVCVPGDALIRPDTRLAEGEATGHFHEAVGEAVSVYEARTGRFLAAPNGCRLQHQEHHAVLLPPGIYAVGRVREYDHFAEEAQEVMD